MKMRIHLNLILMLNPFPFLLSLSFFAPLLLRVTLGGTLLWYSFKKLQSIRSSASSSPILHLYIPLAINTLVGILLFIGAWTQYAAIVSAVYSLILLIKEIVSQKRADRIIIHIILCVIALSLATTGAGILAFDLPL